MIILKEEDCTVWRNFLPFIYQNTYQSDNSKEIEIRNRREGFFTLIAVPLYSPLLRGVAKRPCFWGETVTKIVFRGRWSNYFLELVFSDQENGGGRFYKPFLEER